MRLFPFQRETILLDCSAQRAEALLYHKVADVSEVDDELEWIDKDPVFSGWVKDGAFSISQKLRRGNAFLPKVKGTIQPSEVGCIIDCMYELFGSTKLLLSFWTIITLVMAFIYTFIKPQPTHALFSMGICIGNYAIAVANFNLQCKRTKRKLTDLFFRN